MKIKVQVRQKPCRSCPPCVEYTMGPIEKTAEMYLHRLALKMSTFTGDSNKKALPDIALLTI